MSSVVDKLFKNRYWVLVEERAFYSDEWIEEVGIMGVNTMEEAEIVLSRFRQVKITIPLLAGYYADSYQLQFMDQNDVPEIFSIIDTHLDNWVKITNRLGYVSPMPPIEDFELLDRLAELLYPYRSADAALVGVFSFLQKSFSNGNSLNLAASVYKPYSPMLFKYCTQVWG